LKELTSVPLEIGDIAHKTIEKILTEYQSNPVRIDPGRVQSYVTRLAELKVRTKVFADVYYEEREAINAETELVEPVLSSMMNFLQSSRHDWILEEAIASRDDWIIELKKPFEFGECLIGHLKGYGRIDALFPVNGDFYIFDWKTGEKGKYSQFDIQLKAYASWTRFHLDAPLQNIQAHIVLLQPQFEEHQMSFNDYDMEIFLDLVKSQTDLMLSYCAEPDFNIPKPREDFPMTENTKLCGYCNYRELCGRE
jgi:hypothetical protein